MNQSVQGVFAFGVCFYTFIFLLPRFILVDGSKTYVWPDLYKFVPPFEGRIGAVAAARLKASRTIWPDMSNTKLRRCTRNTSSLRAYAGYAVAAVALLAGKSVVAIELVKVSPQGEVGRLQNVSVQFKEAVVPLGDPRGSAPVALQCSPGVRVDGQGRWTNEKEWVFDFRQALPSGARCRISVNEDFKPSAPGANPQWQGPRSFTFNIAAPTVDQVRPWEGSQIEEDQRFLLRLSGAANESTIANGMWCESKAIGERIPVKLYSAGERDSLMKALKLDAKQQPWVLVGCQRPLPAGVDSALVWGPGIAAAVDDAVRTRGEHRYRFTVRQPLTAEFSCERERANAPCLPILPLSVSFSEAIPRAQALAIRLRGSDNQLIAPVSPDSDGSDSESASLTSVRFPVPLPEDQQFKIELPSGIRDLSGRPLANSASFPLTVRTGAAPPLAKFAAAPFGIVEWEREGPSLVPLSLRHVQQELRAGGAGQLRVKRIGEDLEALRWHAKLYKASQAEWDTRKEELLRGESGLQTLTVPAPSPAEKSINVVGIPLTQPGYHVLELQSPQLGQSLLETRRPMYVRTGVLVTNLGLHFKRGRDNSLAWVTSLDKGRPVSDAQIAVYDCAGTQLWTGKTDANGLARIDQQNLGRNERQRCVGESGLFVTARLEQAGRPTDFSFMFTAWDRGIETWRFNAPISYGSESQARAHTVTDRPMLRAGETLSMKHFFRLETMQGLNDAPPDQLPNRLRVVFEGTGEDVTTIDLPWQGSRYALSTWKVPPGAKLGTYRLILERTTGTANRRRSWDSGSVRVEEFRVPLVDARLLPPKAPSVGAKDYTWGAQLNYMAGGPMAKSPVQINAVLQPRWQSVAGYEDFAFEPPSERDAQRGAVDEGDGPEDGEGDGGQSAAESRGNRLLLDKLAVQTDAQGAAQFRVPVRAPLDRPSELRVELNYRDPDGQTHTRAASQTLWPAEVQVGIRAASWVANGQTLQVNAVALDTNGKPVSGRSISISGRQLQTLSTRKRLVGGFYGYEHQSTAKDMGELCRGTSDAQGLIRCDVKLTQSGQLELIATATDTSNRSAKAARSVWVTRAGQLWFSQDNDDRIDVIPERRRWEPGETARFQVRMPYREATALVTVEREGLMHSEVRQLSGTDPWIDLKIQKDWTPNAYVSVMVLRGRLRDVPWYSFFSWGWREPLNWWREWRASGDYQPPTAMVDLSKPSFKLGMAMIEVGRAKHQLQVDVVPQETQYGVRQTAQVKLRVTQDGKPVPDALIAFAAVDEGLLALAPNTSWKLLDSLLQTRPWAVSTSTAHSEIIGRRHYGRKAVAAGGGGGFATRELFDTLLTWQPAVQVNAQGEAVVQVPLNDSLTRFRLVAVADAPGQRFGTGENSIKVSQDLQLLSGLPPLVREGDRVQAMMTLRNASNRAMDLRITLQGKATTDGGEQPLIQEPQTLKLAAGAAQELSWSVVVPEGAQRITWEAVATEQGAGAAKDAMRTTQQVEPAVPLRVMQATLKQLDGPMSLPVAPPSDALPAQGAKRGGLQIGLQPRLSSALPGIRRFFETYPYTCLEQQSSRLLALHDAGGWDGLMGRLSTYQDGDGLFAYFPLSNYITQGSDVLTAYVLSAAQEGGRRLPEAQLNKALDGLSAFVEGRIARRYWSPRPDDEPRRVAALAALARYGRATPRQLATVDARNLPTWPTSAVIDWLVIHQRMTQAPQREAQISGAQTQLRSRLSYAGTTLRFVNEDTDAWWWLMDSGDGNAARVILALVDDPSWREDLPRIITGTLARQERGAWYSTTANLWGALALERFSAKFEAQAVKGRTEAQLAGKSAVQEWSVKPDGSVLPLPWPAGGSNPLSITHTGDGKPWATVQALAAVPLKAPLTAGYSIKRSLQPVSQKAAPAWTRGDVMRVRLEIDAAADMTWVVLSDPLPTGASIVDGTIESQGERREGEAWPDFIERSFSAWRAYFSYLPRGHHVLEYTVRLNNAGRFQMPSTRAEAMYAPDRFGELPNATLEVAP
ncbi:alpha-2-macroglobulin family protein [Roseateles amylovorans]|uniref:MG2 domain-containing protein n=1 Tax=Roseateles amylovorans TaxID=2978473 RepID=A0ABY6B3W5_9BURK|nr:alpha-2-macroglobulin family protein [Roseateles amylovorans]UXH79752.1 MG2 domain-containing protein [Roseateles amylovorans]